MLRKYLPCCKKDYRKEMLTWNAATNEVLLEAERGEPPASRALCPVCRFPLLYSPGSWIGGTATCSRSDEEFNLSEPHFFCDGEDCGSFVSFEEGPGVIIDREYEVYIEEDRQVGAEQMKVGAKGQVHTRGITLNNPGLRSADAIVSIAQRLGEQIQQEREDQLDKEWDIDNAFATVDSQEILSLAEEARSILASQDTLVEVGTPCTVFGDTHGQLRDLLLMFNVYGWPGTDGRHFVFNGDFVDRGAHQVEVAMIVLACKVKWPGNIWLVRGNHEDAVVNKKYGFDQACIGYCVDGKGSEVFQAFQNCFNLLPLASLIGGKILTVHGGLGDGHWSLDDLRAIRRPLTHDTISSNVFVHNILWSDPVEEDDPKERDTSGLHTSPRGKNAVKFGWDVTLDFCIRNDVSMIIRSHQFKKQGYGFDVMHDNMLIRVFTARDYEAKNQNDGAILKITQEDSGLLCVKPQVLRSITKDSD